MSQLDDIYAHLIDIRGELGEVKAELRSQRRYAAWWGGVVSAVIAAACSSAIVAMSH